MLRLLFILMPSLLIACSKDKPTPVAPAGKVVVAPAAPANLRFEAVTDSSCRVRWDAADGATDYDVNYKPAAGGRWTNEPHRGVRLYNTIYDLEPNTEYRWAARAENRDGPSQWVFGPNFTTLPDGAFDIELVFISDRFTRSDQELIRQVADLWEQIVVGDLPDYVFDAPTYVYQQPIDKDEVIDDLRIYVDAFPDDDESRGYAGLAYATRERSDSGLPAVGKIVLHPRIHDDGSHRDPPDYQSIVAHEIAHVLGIGMGFAWWDNIRDRKDDPHFIGERAIQAFDADGGFPYTGSKVPINHDLIHWDHNTMPSEIMTGGFDGDVRISNVTVAALADFGYEVRPSPTEHVPIIPVSYGRGKREVRFKEEPFDIEIVFSDRLDDIQRPFSDREKMIFRRAADRWEGIIINGVPDHVFTQDSRYVNWPYSKGDRVDDIRLYVEPASFTAPEDEDWPFYAGSHSIEEVIRPVSGLPIASEIIIVYQEVAAHYAGLTWAEWESLVLHQIGHALGFGIHYKSWYAQVNSDVEPWMFMGNHAVYYLNKLLGTSHIGVRLRKEPPISWTYEHWDGDLLPNDLMSIGPNKAKWEGQITSVTIGAMADLGYTVQFPDGTTKAAKVAAEEEDPYYWCGVGRSF